MQQTIPNIQKHIEFVPLVGHNLNFQIFISVTGDVKDEPMKYVWLNSALFENENIKENAEVLIKFLASVNALIINPMSIELSIEL